MNGLCRPTITEPLYVGGRAVLVDGHLAEAYVEIYRYDVHGNLDPNNPIGDRDAPSDRNFSVPVAVLNPGDRIFAKQKHDSLESTDVPFNQATEVQAYQGLTDLRVRPIYECARVVEVRNITHGAFVELFQQEVGAEDDWARVARGYFGGAGVDFSLRTPAEIGLEFKAHQSFPDEWSDSNIVPVERYTGGRLGRPTILGRSVEPEQVFLPECATSFEVALRQEEPAGGTVHVYPAGSDVDHSIATEIADWPVTNMHPEEVLQAGWELVAVHELCGRADRSSESYPATVISLEEYFDRFPPVILRSRVPGEGHIVEAPGAHESTIRIYLNGELAGTGTSFGRTRLQLDNIIDEIAEVVQVSMSFMCDGEERTGWGEELPVDELPWSEPFDENEINELLEAHNEWRQRYANKGVEPLTWSGWLADYAQWWANILAATGTFDHSYGPYGENIHEGPRTNAGDVLGGWCEQEEEVYLNYEPPEPAIDNTNFRDFGHFTQVVWSGTKKLGGGRASSARGREFWVCSYYPAGNVTGSWPYET